jgi:hypothetical protein
LVVLEVLRLFNDFRGNLVIFVFDGHFGHFFTFQDCFDYLGDFKGILAILQVFGDFFFSHFRSFVIILIILVILYFWSIYRYFGDFRGILIKKISFGGILVVLEILILF